MNARTHRLSPVQSAWVILGWLFVLLAWAPPVVAQDAPFAGVIVEDNTVVRAGGGNPFYAVARLPKGTQVNVEEVVFGWYRIAPPAGSASVIEKSQVQVSADGKTATVSVDSAPVFAASIETDNTSPNKHWRRQLNLERGKSVQILGEDGKFYLIAPLPGTSVYVAPTALRRVDTSVTAMTTPASPMPPAPLVPPTPPTTAPAPAPVTVAPANVASPAVPSAATPLPNPTPSPDRATLATTTPTVASPPAAVPMPVAEAPTSGVQTPATTDPAPVSVTVAPQPAPAPVLPVVTVRQPTPAFVELEQRFREAMALPLEEQPTDELLVAYRAIQRDPGLLPSESRTIVARLMQLERNQNLATQLKDLAGLKDELNQRQEKIVSVRIESERRAHAPSTGVPGEGKYYDAVGQLVGSAVYDGHRMPRLYRLLDASSRRTVAYVQPSDKLDPKIYLGQVVGLLGTSRYDPSLKLNIFEVKSADILQPNPNY